MKNSEKESLLSTVKPSKAIVELAIPATLALLAKAVYNIVDTAYIGMLHSDIALAALAETEQLADQVIAQVIREGMSQREMAEALYAYVTSTVSYDQRYYSDRSSMPYESQTALGALRDGMAICGGYSHAVKRLFEKVGIPCYNVTGKYFSENHMWNIALLDGQWLWFDATSDRGSTGEFGFLRFGLTELDGKKYQWNQNEVLKLIG